MYRNFEHYKNERAALIQRDRSLRTDHSEVLSEEEIKADRVLREIRAVEAATIWNEKYSDIEHPFPGMEFLTGRSIVVQTKLFKILSKARVLLATPFNTWVQLHTARDTFNASLAPTRRIAHIILLIRSGTNLLASLPFLEDWSTFVPVWRKYIYEFLRSSAEDGISYLEARVMFSMEYMIGEDGAQNVPHREWLLIFDEVQNALKADLRAQGKEDEFIGARIIYTALRFIPTEELDWFCEDCISLKKEFPHLIAGFDLAGPENIPPPLINYAEGLLRFRERQREEEVDIPLLLHAGETCGDGTHADMNLYDAILLGSKRIGHGFSLVKHPSLMQECREKGVLVEVCPISNEVLRLTSNMPMHPLPILLNNGVPVSISSDDPGVFGNPGLSFDMYQVLASSEITGLITLRELARDSLKYSTLDPETKERALDHWNRRWESFVKWVADSSS
ncbi:Adenosine deaminase CECR1-A [Mycena sanguinolenta]|uniref:Adenosine deaminase n=1 Tax=Mycena sanguinolenta TaxID=230812 RepID=A0A8H6XMR6_9AGAR|nr:Adenosine deaminase CECR1-A [Mycena sanguinolenta]